jgi:hypothetical protein
VAGSGDSTRGYASGNRVVRWLYALELLKGKYYVLPSGFTYQKMFGCHFVNCDDIDYPHNVIFSEWLIGGIFGLLVIGSVFLKQFFILWREPSSNIKRVLIGSSVVMLMNLWISGDYLASSSMAIVIMIITMQWGISPKEA